MRRTPLAFVCLIVTSLYTTASLADVPLQLTPTVQTPGQIEVDLCCFRNHDGWLFMALYNSKDGWLKDDQAVWKAQLKITGDKMQVSVPPLNPGRYALSVLHDENGNGELDMHWMPPRPAEGVGASNDAKMSFGPPHYEDAAFPLTEQPRSLAVKVQYAPE